MQTSMARVRAGDDDDDVLSSSDDELSVGASALSAELLAELRPEALAALQEVLAAKTAAKAPSADGVVSEDWHLSQFWYTAETSRMLAREIARATAASGVDGPIACVSCPSTHAAFKARTLETACVLACSWQTCQSRVWLCASRELLRRRLVVYRPLRVVPQCCVHRCRPAIINA